MNNPAFDFGFNFAAIALGVDPREYSKGGIPKHASVSVGRNVCLAGSLLFHLTGQTDSPAFCKLASAAQSPGWERWQAEAAEDVASILEPVYQLFLSKQANVPGAVGTAMSVFNPLPGFVKRIPVLSSLAVAPGLLNLYTNIVATSALLGAGAGALNWHSKRLLEKDEKPVEEARAEHMILRQAIGDIEARMAAREAARNGLV